MQSAGLRRGADGCRRRCQIGATAGAARPYGSTHQGGGIVARKAHAAGSQVGIAPGGVVSSHSGSRRSDLQGAAGRQAAAAGQAQPDAVGALRGDRALTRRRCWLYNEGE